MTLNQYLRRHKTTVSEFARENGISVFTVRKWTRGERIPRPKSAARIMRITGGKVTGNDWLRVDA